MKKIILVVVSIVVIVTGIMGYKVYEKIELNNAFSDAGFKFSTGHYHKKIKEGGIEYRFRVTGSLLTSKKFTLYTEVYNPNVSPEVQFSLVTNLSSKEPNMGVGLPESNTENGYCPLIDDATKMDLNGTDDLGKPVVFGCGKETDMLNDYQPYIQKTLKIIHDKKMFGPLQDEWDYNLKNAKGVEVK